MPYTWDARGNLTSDGVFTYTYSAAGQWVRAQSVTATLVYTYTADGLRVAQSSNGVVTSFVWDWAVPVVPELLSAGATRYLLGAETLGQWDGAAWTYVLPDALGSVRQTVDGAGAVTADREWSPYGAEVGGAQAGLGYTGEWQDVDVGLVYLRARWYQAETGRFLSKDAIANNHPYQYAKANPLSYTDPSGQDAGCPGHDAGHCGGTPAWMAEAAVAACREYGAAGGCYLWEGAHWYLYFTGSQQGAGDYLHGTGMAAGAEGRYRSTVAREWAGYAYGKGWISSAQNLRFWPTPEQPLPELAAFIALAFAGPAVAEVSATWCWQPQFRAVDLGPDIYPNPGLPENFRRPGLPARTPEESWLMGQMTKEEFYKLQGLAIKFGKRIVLVGSISETDSALFERYLKQGRLEEEWRAKKWWSDLSTFGKGDVDLWAGADLTPSELTEISEVFHGWTVDATGYSVQRYPTLDDLGRQAGVLVFEPNGHVWRISAPWQP